MTDCKSIKIAENSEMLAALQSALLNWFAAEARDLPWRATRDAYRILVSEIMLQQTQVDRVLPKYAAFIERFPTLEALAEAPTAEVIRFWAGLGYNRRAVNLQRAARAVLEQHQGVFPRDVAALLKLPGIGPYTAGALACFAFEQDVAFMDTNIRRVIWRALAEPGSAGSDAALLPLARVAVPAGQGWAWNQAIMELGALICTAESPACWRCPLREWCRDYAARRASDEQLLAVAPARRVAERRETPFVGSNRYYRGRVIAALRTAPPGESLALTELGPLLRAEYTSADEPWLRALVEGLARDGLALVDRDSVRLPE